MRLTTSKEETFANELKSFIEIASRNTHVFLTKLSHFISHYQDHRLTKLSNFIGNYKNK